jgi:phosphopantetheine adenylyltransferase
MDRKIYVIYPGRFQPFHKGHKQVYDTLTSKFGTSSVYISTTNDTSDLNRSPFNYKEKNKIISLNGIPSNRIINVKSNYNIDSIVDILNSSGFDINSDVVLFVVSKKDMDENPRFSKFTKKDGSMSYLQPFDKYKNELKPANAHGYLYIVSTNTFSVQGKTITSASEIRSMYQNLSGDNSKKQFLSDLYDITDKSKINSLYSIIDPKLSNSNQDVSSKDNVKGNKKLKETLKRYLKKEGFLSDLSADPKKTLDSLKSNLEKARDMEKEIMGKRN